MTTKHTAGPWGIAKIDCGAADDEIVAEVGGCIVNICAVFGENAYSMATIDRNNEPHYEVSKDESDANARLISVSPELLDFANKIAKIDPNEIGNLPLMMRVLHDEAAELVAKATNS